MLQYNVCFEGAALVFLIIILLELFTNFRTENKKNKIFRTIVLVSILSIAMDIVTAFTISYYELINPKINILLNSLYFMISNVTPFMSARYVSLNIHKDKQNKYLLRVDQFLLVFYVFILFINLFNGLVFTFTEDKGYIHGPLYIINYLLPTYFIIEVIVVALKNRKKISLAKLISNLSFGFCAIVCLILQLFFFPDVLLTNFGAALAACIMLFYLETPDFVELEHLRQGLEEEINEKALEIETLSLQTIEALVTTIDAKDDYTKGHSSRVALFSKMLALKVGYTEDDADILYRSALLHDIGKIGIPDYILNKKGRLTNEEYEKMKEHSAIGAEILKKITSLPDASYIAGHHHERYDGKGYPDGLKGTDIKECARIVCITDSFDAMFFPRVYRAAFDKERIIQEFKDNCGTQFDPNLVPVFIQMIESEEIMSEIDRHGITY